MQSVDVNCLQKFVIERYYVNSQQMQSVAENGGDECKSVLQVDGVESFIKGAFRYLNNKINITFVPIYSPSLRCGLIFNKDPDKSI